MTVGKLILPPKKTIPVWRSFEPILLVKKLEGNLGINVKEIPNKSAIAACPLTKATLNRMAANI